MNINQIDFSKLHLSRCDLILVEKLKKYPSDFFNLPIAQLSQKYGVSESSITRFVRKIGFDNLKNFKLSLAQSFAIDKNFNIISDNIHCKEPIKITIQKLLANNISALEMTVNHLNEKNILKATDLLLKSKKIIFIGLGNSGFIANDSAYKFMRIGFNAYGIDNSHLMMINSSLTNENDLIIAITHSGKSKEIIKAIEIAKKNSCKIITITADIISPASKKSDLSLSYTTHETILQTGSITTKLSQIFIIDLIYTQVVKQIPNKSIFFKQRTMEAINTLHQNE